MKYDDKAKNPKIKTEVVRGFLGGLNSFQDQSLIRDNELTDAKNIILSIDGVSPRYGTTVEGDTSGTKVYGALGYYKSDGTREFLRVANGKLQKLSSGTWSAIGSTAFSNVKTDLLMARDKVYCFNGTDDLRVYDGTTITTYTALDETASVTVTPTGTSGSTAYSYIVTAFNDQGETVGTTGTTATGNATLSSTNYNALSWDAVTNATGYNIYGRKASGYGEVYLSTVYGATTYNDTGADTPNVDILPPEDNATGGIVGKFSCFAISRIFVAGNSDNPSRLYWGGVADKLDNFSLAPEGGGYVDIFKNDGAVIRAIIPFQGGVIVGKDNAIYKFYFNADGDATLEEITRSFGMISHYATKAVENDIIFPAKKDGRLAFYSLGNQENYAASILRTNELSIKIATDLENVALGYLDQSWSFYYRNIYGCAIPTSGQTGNNKIWCLDTRFGAWVYWDGITPSCFAEFTDTTGAQDMYYGDESDGYMYKMFQDARNDNGTAISVRFATKAFDQGAFHKYKWFLLPEFQFKDISLVGSISGEIVKDGTIVTSEFTVTGATAGGLGFGAMLFGVAQFGDATGGTPSSGESSDTLKKLYSKYEARSIKYIFSSSTAGMNYKFLSIAHDTIMTDSRQHQESFMVYS